MYFNLILFIYQYSSKGNLGFWFEVRKEVFLKEKEQLKVLQSC